MLFNHLLILPEDHSSFHHQGQRPAIGSSNGGVWVGVLHWGATAIRWVVVIDFDIPRRKVAEVRIIGGREIGRLTSVEIADTVESKEMRALFQRCVLRGGSRSGEKGACDQG